MPNTSPNEAEAFQTNVREGARNLLENCAGVEPGQHVLIVREPEAIHYYDQSVPNIIEAQAERMGARVHSLRTPPIDGPR